MTAAGAAGTVRGRLRVNVDPFFSRIVLAAQVATFLNRHPNVRVELIMRATMSATWSQTVSIWRCDSANHRVGRWSPAS
jgi:DNA-binding transcriptional LysR family regulator